MSDLNFIEPKNPQRGAVTMKHRTSIAGLRFRLKDARLKTGISVSEVARRLQCKRSAVYAWEDGTNEPRAVKLRQLADLYSISHEYLVSGDDAVLRDVTKVQLRSINDPERYAECKRAMTGVKRAQLWRLDTDIMAG